MQLLVNVSEADLSASQIVTIAVVNPGPGGGSSETRSFIIHDPIHTIYSAKRLIGRGVARMSFRL